MRTYTLVFSIIAHACAAGAMLFTTVLATGDMPEPHDASTFVNVVAVLPASAPPPAVRPRAQPVVSPAAAPLEAPAGVHAEIDRPLIVETGEPIPEGVIGGVGSDAGIALPNEPPPPAPVPSVPTRVGGVIKPPRKIADVAPGYPEMARAARVSGIVIIEATIDEEGNVRDARVLRSIPLLDRAAVDAVRQWRFTPTVLNGQVIPIVMTVTVNFRLD